MDHLAQDLGTALEESESCGPITFSTDNNCEWRMRRRTRSAGNLFLYVQNSGDNNGEDSSSSNSEQRREKRKSKLPSFHHSDSDENSLCRVFTKAIHNKSSTKVKHALHSYVRGKYRKFGVNHSLESDSVNENSPARPSLRRKRKLKRMSIDEAPAMPQCGKRKRSQRLDNFDGSRCLKHNRIKPLHQSLVDKIERIFQSTPAAMEDSTMETQSIEDCEFSESSISWSGGEGHDGDDELTDWAPSMENPSTMDQSLLDADPREMRSGCRRLGDERPGFSISTGANERVAKFLQDTTKTELKLFGCEREKLGQLATLYSLDLCFENPNSLLLRKTNKTPCMQPPLKHHSGLNAGHKRIRTFNEN